MTSEGSWVIDTVDGAAVRLRSGRIGLVTVDVTAPISGGELLATTEQVTLTLRLALDELRTRNFLMQAAARTLVSRNDAHVLTYVGVGIPGEAPWRVTGHATAGSVDVELALTITPCGPTSDPMSEIELAGSASMGTVHLPLPGLGTVEDFRFDVTARVVLWRRKA